MNERITVELSRGEWIALIAVAVYGGIVVDNIFGTHTAEQADLAVSLIQKQLDITSIEAEAEKLESLTDTPGQADDVMLPGFSPPTNEEPPAVTSPILDEVRQRQRAYQPQHEPAYYNIVIGWLTLRGFETKSAEQIDQMDLPPHIRQIAEKAAITPSD
jgi:hypothetical protein